MTQDNWRSLAKRIERGGQYLEALLVVFFLVFVILAFGGHDIVWWLRALYFLAAGSLLWACEWLSRTITQARRAGSKSGTKPLDGQDGLDSKGDVKGTGNG